MYREYQFHSRDDLISFGERIGGVIEASQRQNPWMICLDGDYGSGKSLLALAIDKALRPQIYPHGIVAGMNADAMLMRRQTGLRTAFYNFGRVVCSTSFSFDRQLAEFEQETPGLRALIASNIERSISGSFNYRANGLASDRLDIALNVRNLPGPFSRRVAMAYKDPALDLPL